MKLRLSLLAALTIAWSLGSVTYAHRAKNSQTPTTGQSLLGADETLSCPEVLQKIDNPFFYSIEKDGHTAYLLGTMHIGISLTTFPAYVLDAIDSADEVVLEIRKEAKIIDFVNQLRILKAMFNLTGPKLSQQLSPQSWELLVKQMEKKGYPENLIDRLTTSGAAILLATSTLDTDKGALDQEIQNRAIKNGTAVGGFESLSFQLKILKGFANIQELEQTIVKLSETDNPEKNIGGIYTRGDFDAMTARLQKDIHEGPLQVQRFLTDRNNNWIPQIITMMKKPGTRFIAVGAMHLAGDAGLIKQLRDRGYKVTRITSEAEYQYPQ